MLKDSEANFRIRFGYRDFVFNNESNEETVINTSNNFDDSFINRTKVSKKNVNGKKSSYVKPVLVYPWTYFKITGLNSNIKNGTDTYEIKGVSSGSYMLSNMALCGISTNFSKEATSDDFRGTPRNVVGKLAKWITMASTDDNENSSKRDITTARICFLGDERGKIITDFDNSEKQFKSDYVYQLRGGQTLNGGNIQSIEEKFFNKSNNQVLNSKNFNIN